MTVTFSGTTVPVPQSEAFEPVPLINETILYSGKTSIQASTSYGKKWSFSCVGTSTQYDALVSAIGASGTLVINGSSYNYCYVKSIGPVVKEPMTSYFTFNVAFVQDTSLS